MAKGVEEARLQGAQVLIGGCDSSSNTFDKLFGDGSDEMLKWVDFCSIHYQGMASPAGVKEWRDRKHPQNGRVLIWDTESWVANTDDRVATVVATNLAAGYDRAVGIFTGNILEVDRKSFQGYDADGKGKRYDRRYHIWSVAPAIGATNHFIGPRKFDSLIFEDGLPYVMRFNDPAPETLLNPGGAPAAGEHGALVVLGDIGEAFEANRVLYRTAKGAAELANKADLITQLGAALTAKDKPAFTKLLNEWNIREPLSGGKLTIANAANHFRLYDFYGNAVAAENGNLIVPLDHRGFYLTGDGTAGSFAALVEAVRGGKIEGVAPLNIAALDFTAPLGTNPELRLRVTNLLNREIEGAFKIVSDGITYADAGAQTLKLAPNEIKTIAFQVTGAAVAADNLYPTQITFTAGNETAIHFENLRVNSIAKKTIVVDGKLEEWTGALPQIVAGGSAAPTFTERAWEPYRQFDTSVKNGYAVGYVAYDDDNFYFAAKIADATPENGTLSLTHRNDDDFYYPEVSYEIDSAKTFTRRVNAPWDFENWKNRALLAPGGNDRIVQFWDAQSQKWFADIVVPQGEARAITFFLFDSDQLQRRYAPIIFTDPSAEDKVLDTRGFRTLGNGLFITYKVSGNVRVTFEPGGWLRPFLGGVFFDAVEGAAPAGNSVEFVGETPAELGKWEGTYGNAGYSLPNGAEKEFTGGAKFTPSTQIDKKSYTWPAGIRRYSYRKRPWLPQGNGQWTFDNVQLAFNALPVEAKPLLSKLPGTPDKFIYYADTDYEYALNQVAPEFGGGYEVVRLRYPGMANKHYYPRQGKAPNDGAAPGAKLAITRDGDSRFVEAALPWSEIPGVKAKLDAGEPVKFTFRVNDGGASNLCLELARYRSVAKVNGSFKVDWTEHRANELEFGWEK
jgi:hypothetical protein